MAMIRKALDTSLHDHCMFWAAYTLGYLGFLHSAKFMVPNLASYSSDLHLMVANVAVDSAVLPSCLHIRIKVSKTDPFRNGCIVHIGKGKAPLCAVQAMLAYLSLQGNVLSPLFLLKDSQPLTRTHTVWLRQIFSYRDFANFSSHSFRIATATVAACNGIPDHLIEALGQWTSNAYHLYIRTTSKA